MVRIQQFQPVDRTAQSGRTLGSRQLATLVPDLAGSRPAYRHLAQAVSAHVLDGRIALHVKLPAERDLAAALHTSRATATAAYDLLRESGFAYSRQGSGTWTSLPQDRTPSGVARLLGPQDTAIDLAKAAAGLPARLFAEALPEASRQLQQHADSPGYHPFGLPGLRAAVADRYTRRGLATLPEQILITSGAQHALTLVLGLLSAPGDRAVIEDSSYTNALEALRRFRLRSAPVPVTESGWDIGTIETTVKQVAPQLAYLVPDFQNPTGCVMPDEERARVLHAGQRSGTWLIIDETLAEIALDVPVPAPFASHAARVEGVRSSPSGL
jgi:DNA-binding transcriptional MocR family regulator